MLRVVDQIYNLLEFVFSENFDTYIKDADIGFDLITQWKTVSKNLWHSNSVFKPVDFLREVQK